MHFGLWTIRKGGIMGIISGFLKTKRYRKLSDGSYQLQSEWTSSDTTEMPDGTTLSEKIKSHPQQASDITGGTFKGQVSSPAGTDYTTSRMRNVVLLPEDNDPGENETTTYSNGSIICVYK